MKKLQVYSFGTLMHRIDNNFIYQDEVDNVCYYFRYVTDVGNIIIRSGLNIVIRKK